MGFVRDNRAAAWVPHGPGLPPLSTGSLRSSSVIAARHARGRKEDPCKTSLYIGLTIVVFAVLWLLVKGVERFER